MLKICYFSYYNLQLRSTSDFYASTSDFCAFNCVLKYTSVQSVIGALQICRWWLTIQYEILIAYTEFEKMQFFILKTNNITRCHAFKLQPSHCRVDVLYVCKYFFSQRVIDPWNSLPATYENFRSLACLKL